MSDRYPDALLALALLPAPAVIQNVDYESIRTARIADLQARLQAAGIPYDVTVLETDPGVILQEEGAFREMLNIASINDAAKAVMILYAHGTDQDNLFALLGLRRVTVTPADPTTTPPTPAVMESDSDFRAAAQIALEGTAPGLTGGGYSLIARSASPQVQRVALITAPGGVVNVILQGRSNGRGTTVMVTNADGSMTGTWTPDTTTPNNDGTVSSAAVQAVAAALNDDWSDDATTGSQLTDIPQVRSASSQGYAVSARGVLPLGPSLANVLAQSLQGLVAAVQSAQLVGNLVPTDALIAAGRVAAMSKFYLDQPAADVAAAPDAAPFCTSVTVTVRYG